jgi:glycosyltransferase involved in cell wall biosynthesis
MPAPVSAVRARILGAGFLAYQYLPLPAHWKDALLGVAFRIAGGVFEGHRAYELWRTREAAPAPQPSLPDAGNRKRILVIDRYVPQPDRDAGSRSTWCVIRALIHMGYSVTFWPRDLLYDAGYVPAMQAEGVHVLWGDALRGRFDAWFARHSSAFDAVLLNRPMIAREFLPSVRRHSRARVLFYGHDLHHARLAREHSLGGSRLLAWESAFMERIERKLWQTADAVYYPSAEETAVVAATVPGARAYTLPLYFFDDAPECSASPAGRGGVVFVAGFAHAPNADAARWLVNEIMPRVWQSVPDAQLSLVGSNPTAEVRSLAGQRVKVTGYVSDEELLRIYRAARVAVVPLRVGAGMKGKVVEALQYGLPLVTTPVGAQGLQDLPAIVPVSDDPATLAAHIAGLLRDDARWIETSRAQSAYAQAMFSRDAMVAALAAGLDMRGVSLPGSRAS